MKNKIVQNKPKTYTKTFIDQLEITTAIFWDSELIGFAIRGDSTCKTYMLEKVLGKQFN